MGRRIPAGGNKDVPWGAARRPVWLERNMLGKAVAAVPGSLVDPQVDFGFFSKCDVKLTSGFRALCDLICD